MDRVEVLALASVQEGALLAGDHGEPAHQGWDGPHHNILELGSGEGLSERKLRGLKSGYGEAFPEMNSRMPVMFG